MTKRVRTENADNSSFKVVVQTWSKSSDGSPDTMSSEVALNNPTDLSESWIHSSQYLVVKEA